MAAATRRTGDLGSMADKSLPLGGESEDLPRTLRREKEAREREARERDMRSQSFTGQEPAYVHPAPAAAPIYADDPQPAAVKRFDVPFLHLMGFFLKAVFAAIPALIVLGGLLFAGGHALKHYAGVAIISVTFAPAGSSETPPRPAAPPPAPATKPR